MSLRPYGSPKYHVVRSKDGEAHTANQIAFQPPAGMAASTVQEAIHELVVMLAQGSLSSLSNPSFYKHIQASPSAVWTINHGLGFRPAVSLFDETGREIDGSVSHTDEFQVTVEFVKPVAGHAFVS